MKKKLNLIITTLITKKNSANKIDENGSNQSLTKPPITV